MLERIPRRAYYISAPGAKDRNFRFMPYERLRFEDGGLYPSLGLAPAIAVTLPRIVSLGRLPTPRQAAIQCWGSWAPEQDNGIGALVSRSCVVPSIEARISVPPWKDRQMDRAFRAAVDAIAWRVTGRCGRDPPRWVSHINPRSSHTP